MEALATSTASVALLSLAWAGGGIIFHCLLTLAMGESHRLKLMRQNHSSHHPLGSQCQNQRVEIYRQSQGVEVLDAPQTLSGEAVLPGFVLDLAEMVSE